MSLRDELEIAETNAAEVQKAYDEAGLYEFMGRRLEPWTVRRHSVALQLRSRLMRAMNDENDSLENFIQSGFYPHVFHDIVIVLYLMHLDKTEVVKLEQLSETAAMDRAYEWAEAIPLTYGSAAFFEGAKVLGKILHSIRVSWFQAAKKEAEQAGDNGQKKIPGAIERPGSLNSFSEQSGQPDSTPITS
jgi:hypothetical protein